MEIIGKTSGKTDFISRTVKDGFGINSLKFCWYRYRQRLRK